MRIIGITGSSGAGKSTICDIIEKEYKVRIINADRVAKELAKKGTKYVEEIRQTFGNDIIDEQGELKRRKLAELIYSDSEKRKKLNNCTFKYIKKEIQKQIENEKAVSIIVIDAPLLFESKLNEICNIVIGVISKKEIQIERIVVRDNIDYEHAEKRINAQITNEEYMRKCDEIIENNDNLEEIKKTVRKIAKKYKIPTR